MTRIYIYIGESVVEGLTNEKTGLGECGGQEV